MRLLARLTAVVAALGLPALAAAPQQPIRVGTNFVRVDAYPMKDGQIVTGLTAEDFEVLEDGAVQKIETFEHVAVTREAGTSRVEPNTTRDMNRAIGNPRSRLFLLFLDGPNVAWKDADQIREPLLKFLRDYVGDDDLVGVMTPGLSASEVTYGRRTDVIEKGLRGTWTWGRLDRDDPQYDEQLIKLGMCYPPASAGDVNAKIVARARERMTLEALRDAVRHLHGLREERKAIVTVTQGWPLYREDPDLLRRRGEGEAPLGVDPIRPGPNGKLTADDPRNRINMLSNSDCDRARAFYASIDDEKFLREIIEDANRGNASFYMIDPGGLRSSRAADRSQAMRTLADNTDGYALLNTNDLERGFKRLADDMSSYYLLGYYASNSRPDGRFRSITVRVRQPGVTVRARKGYRAPTADEVSAAVRKAEPPIADGAAPVRAALEALQRIRPNARFHLNPVAGGGPLRKFWVAGEVQSSGSRPDEFMQGATATIEILGTGPTLTQAVTLKSGERTFLVKFDLPSGTAGTLDVRARLVSDDGVAEPLTEAARVDLESATPGALLFRRGVTTGNRVVPAGDRRISRTDRIRLEIPVGPGPRDASAPAGRVLDRNGAATVVPVTVGERNDESTGQRWLTADVTLGPLSPADYAIEVTFTRDGTTEQVLTPIRVIR